MRRRRTGLQPRCVPRHSTAVASQASRCAQHLLRQANGEWHGPGQRGAVWVTWADFNCSGGAYSYKNQKKGAIPAGFTFVPAVPGQELRNPQSIVVDPGATEKRKVTRGAGEEVRGPVRREAPSSAGKEGHTQFEPERTRTRRWPLAGPWITALTHVPSPLACAHRTTAALRARLAGSLHHQPRAAGVSPTAQAASPLRHLLALRRWHPTSWRRSCRCARLGRRSA
jgi:hypothetical protein